MMVYASRYLDLTIAVANLGHLRPMQWYNLVMKVLFLVTQSSVLYNMMRRLRATYNPHLDNFRIELLIVPCLLLSVMRSVFVFGFNIIEVLHYIYLLTYLVILVVLLDLLHPARVGGRPAANVYAAQDGRGGDDHDALLVLHRLLPRHVHVQLDLPLLAEQPARAGCRVGGAGAGRLVFRLFLHLLPAVPTYTYYY